ncbi:hypothetical protein N9937_01550 [bacterium]|nr:hypothetical protein [bacterium]
MGNRMGRLFRKFRRKAGALIPGKIEGGIDEDRMFHYFARQDESSFRLLTGLMDHCELALLDEARDIEIPAEERLRCLAGSDALANLRNMVKEYRTEGIAIQQREQAQMRAAEERKLAGAAKVAQSYG